MCLTIPALTGKVGDGQSRPQPKTEIRKHMKAKDQPTPTGSVIHRYRIAFNGTTTVQVRKGAKFLSILPSMTQPGTITVAALVPDYAEGVEPPMSDQTFLALHTGVSMPPMDGQAHVGSFGPIHIFAVTPTFAQTLLEFFPVL
jgi:hypothetical protein